MISEGGITLGTPKRISPNVFFTNKDEEALDSFIIAMAAWFNDFKTYQLHGMEAEKRIQPLHDKMGKEEPSKEDQMEARLAYSYYNHSIRLIAAHLIELFEAIKENEDHLRHPTFYKAVNDIAKDRQQYLNVVLRLGTGELIPGKEYQEFLKLKNLLVRMRSSGTYHYSKTKYFKKGYVHYFKQQEGNEPYYCSSESPGGTRFFFADRIQVEIFQELETNYPPETIHEFAGVAQHAIKDLVESYIRIKEKELWAERVSKWTFTKILA